MDYDPNLPLPGQRRIPRYWFLWAWYRAVAAMLVVVTVGFLGSKWGESRILGDVLERRHNPLTFEEAQEFASTMAGLEFGAPLRVQFAGYAADVFLFAPVLLTLCLAGVFAVGATWCRWR